MDRFVKRQNIAHYQALLKSGSLDDEQRRMILKLLAEEERRQMEGEESASGSNKTPRGPAD